MMIGTKRKGSITEDDTTLLLQRYSATTILALLQEISQYADSKIDWNTLVKRTNTGISSASEYKMLWRHLAYRDALIEKLENGAETMDDDSDLEFELEPSPSVSNEASMEGAAAVKVLMAYGLSNDSGHSNRSTAETPLSLNAHNSQAVPSENLQLVCYALGSEGKQPLSTRSSLEGFDGNGPTSSNYQVRRKRKLWSHEEDMELIAAVQKCGEGNWASILKGNFKHDRTASQLSQRWAIIRKRKSNLNSSSSGGQTATTLTEAQLAARQAVSYALNMPMMGSLSAIGPPNSSIPVTTSEALLQQDSSVAPVLRAPCHSKPRPGQKKPSSSAPVKCSIQEVAVAAGARIATPSTAASLFKAAQAKNIVHVQRAGTLPFGSRSANVHYIRAASGVVPTVPRAAGQGGPMRLASISKPNLPAPSTSSSRPTQQSCLNSKSTSVVIPSSSSGEVVKNSGKLDSSSEIPEGLIKEEASSPNLALDRDLTTIAGENLTLAVDSTAVSNTDSSENANMIEELTDKPVTEVDKDHSMGEEATCENQSMDEAVACSLTSEYENQTVDRKQINLANHGACDDQLATRKAGVSSPPVDNEVDKNTTMVSEATVKMELDLPNDELLGEPSFVQDARTDRIM